MTLVGREEPLRSLRAALEGALAGRGQLVLVRGDAGIGKSAVAAVIAREAETRGAAVTWGRAWEFADAPPHFPVWPCLRALGIETRSAEPRDDERAFQLWERVLEALVRAASGVPVVWIVEDLHAADLGTLDLLTFLAQPLRAIRGLVIATARLDDHRLTDRMKQRLSRMARDGGDVRLDPLAEREIAELTEAALGHPAPGPTLRRLADLTGGNPLFLTECVRALASADGVERALAALPTTVRQVVLDRLGSLPPATRQALASGAVVGREFSAALVARMEETAPARIADALLPALRDGLLREAGPGLFVFSHALVHESIDAALGDEERAVLHGRADRALALLGETADILVERARHALAALRAGEVTDALAVADRATDLLELEGAFDRAFELQARVGAARAAGLLPPAPPARALHIAEIARNAGRSEASRRLCLDLVATARAAGDAELLARAALLLSADVRIGVVDRSQVAVLEEARAGLGDRSPELGCRVLARLATAVQPAADPAVPEAMAREALRRAHERDSGPLIMDVLELAGWGLWFAPLADRTAWSAELLRRALEARDGSKALTAYAWLALQHLEGGDFDGFDQATASMLELSAQLGHPRHRWRALLLAATQAAMHGRFAASDRYFTEVVQLAALIDEPALAMSIVAHDVMRAKLQRRDDALPEGLARLDEALRDMRDAVMFGAMCRASCAARAEDVAATRNELARTGISVAALAGDVRLSAFLAEAYALAGSDHERRVVRDTLARGPMVCSTGDQVTFSFDGTVGRSLGLLDAALGDLAGAETHLRTAYTLARSRGQRPWVAQIAYELAKVLRRAGHHAEARDLVDECVALARELGMRGLAGSASVRAEPDGRPLVMRRVGEIWSVEHGATVARVKDSRGMQLLARLVEQPGAEIHVLALASDEVAAAPESNAGEMLDEQARLAYRRRLAELEDQRLAAETDADPVRAATVERERKALRQELARAAGLGGRVRQAGSATERARINVQRRLKDAIARIRDADENLGRFFETSIRTGTYCCFRP